MPSLKDICITVLSPAFFVCHANPVRAFRALPMLLALQFLISPAALAEGFGGGMPPPVMVPTDVTNVPLIQGGSMVPPYMPKMDSTSAVHKLQSSAFPSPDKANDQPSGVIIVARRGTNFQISSPAFVDLTEGTLFVSVRKPATVVFVNTPQGTVAIQSDGESQIRFEDGILRVLNLSAFGERVKVQIHHAAVSAKLVLGPSKSDPGTIGTAGTSGTTGSASTQTAPAANVTKKPDAAGGPRAGIGPFTAADLKKTKLPPGMEELNSFDSAGPDGVDGSPSPSVASTEGMVMALKIGHELLASDRALTHDDLMPTDGIARRRSAIFENDHMGVCEFSLTSAMLNSDFLSTLSQLHPDPKEMRVLNDLAKMASVLDYVNNGGGYVARGKSK